MAISSFIIYVCIILLIITFKQNKNTHKFLKTLKKYRKDKGRFLSILLDIISDVTIPVEDYGLLTMFPYDEEIQYLLYRDETDNSI